MLVWFLRDAPLEVQLLQPRREQSIWLSGTYKGVSVRLRDRGQAVTSGGNTSQSVTPDSLKKEEGKAKEVILGLPEHLMTHGVLAMGFRLALRPICLSNGPSLIITSSSSLTTIHCKTHFFLLHASAAEFLFSYTPIVSPHAGTILIKFLVCFPNPGCFGQKLLS